ncbi:MAG: hypothetical protein RIG62_21995 [Cyclobacteriaceae bacterium]
MRNFKSYEKEIFRELYKDKSVDIYFFYEKYGLSPAHIAKFILNCREKDLVQYSDGKILLTQSGISYVDENKKEIYLDSITRWKKIPKNMKLEIQPTIEEILTLSNNDEQSFLQYKEKKGAD